MIPTTSMKRGCHEDKEEEKEEWGGGEGGHRKTVKYKKIKIKIFVVL
jgi:hypothetical protein